MNENANKLMQQRRRVAEAVRTACITAALHAYEEGGIFGLCAEGRWEYAVSALQRLDMEALLAEIVEEAAESD